MADVFNASLVSYVERTTTASSTSATYAEYTGLTTPSLPAGDYLIWWTINANNDNTGGSFSAKCEVDNTTQIMASARADTSQLRETHSASTTTQAHHRSGFRVVTLGAGAHDIDLDFNQQGTGTANFYFGAIAIWRVG